MLDTLPDIQKQIIKLYYGFVDGNKYSNEEIAQILGYNNRERIRQIKEDALSTLSMRIYSNIYRTDAFNEDILKERYSKLGKTSRDKREEELEDIIINCFSKEKLMNIIRNLPDIYKNVFILYYGLGDGHCYSIKEISLLLDKEQSIVRDRKRKAVRLVAENVCNVKNFSYPDEFVKKYIRMKKQEKKINQ